MEATRSSETSVCNKPAGCHIPKVGVLHFLSRICCLYAFLLLNCCLVNWPFESPWGCVTWSFVLICCLEENACQKWQFIIHIPNSKVIKIICPENRLLIAIEFSQKSVSFTVAAVRTSNYIDLLSQTEECQRCSISERRCPSGCHRGVWSGEQWHCRARSRGCSVSHLYENFPSRSYWGNS
jgi:hypothetical protein